MFLSKRAKKCESSARREHVRDRKVFILHLFGITELENPALGFGVSAFFGVTAQVVR